jgi:hypothetical protein
MNGALYTDGQNNSYPVIIANQMKLAGGGDFNIPTIGSANGFYAVSGTNILGRLKLKLIPAPVVPTCPATGPSPSPMPLAGEAPTAFTGNKTALNNFGVPGVTLLTAQIPALGGPANPPGVVPPPNPAFNALYQRFASNPSTDGVTGSTLIGDASNALKNGGTFFTFWLGNNDVLGYATGGASNPAILTSQADFDTRLNAALSSMLTAKADAEGAVANIPDIGGIPYFKTVPYNPVVFLTCNPVHVATVAQLNGLTAYGGFNAALDGLVGAGAISASEAAKRKVVFKTGTSNSTGANALVITDETLTDLSPLLSSINPALAGFGRVRQANASDLITLPAASIIPTGVGISSPMGDSYVLLPSEQAEIQTVVDGFNAKIAAAVNSNSSRLVLVDVNAAFKEVAKGTLLVNGSSLTSSISPPFGGFSLDGVHPNARGYAYIANLFIQAINAKWGSTIPLCNPNNYPSNELPSP